MENHHSKNGGLTGKWDEICGIMENGGRKLGFNWESFKKWRFNWKMHEHEL